jgi:starch phosphorylase
MGIRAAAACFLIPWQPAIAGYGYGIRYEYGIFQQEIMNGYQLEKPDNWFDSGILGDCPPEHTYGFGLRAGWS